MAKLKLHYFDMKWLGEPVRMILAVGGIDFQDIRFTMKEWPAIKPTTPLGQAPYIEFEGGKRLAQTKAISRYLAKQTGLFPESDWDAARCDMVVEYSDDLRQPFAPVFLEPNKDVQKKLLTKYVKDVPKLLDNFEKLLTENGSNGHFVGDKLTWADIYVYAMLNLIYTGTNMLGEGITFDLHPQIQAFVAKVEAVPSIAAWLEKRPKSDV
ncbi:hypothetical protein CAPTEDRAFT_165166 [Capitella teleta]|uniref:Glutathione transferase n=1 Tax=Capitella teleta TaxID=283909 RepID=R7U4Y2_CAPTE|nr:hypothetical protein CAPTEDRAFT_165166 [Capitella teleta]|eukprot:ELU01181.1 hypothetical protein CAPTEDRAFT_165166 [Capitella teleta]